MLYCEILPRRGLHPRQYQFLGRVLTPLADRQPALEDLLAGELPRPLILQKLAEPRLNEMARALVGPTYRRHVLRVLRRRLGSQVSVRSLCIPLPDAQVWRALGLMLEVGLVEEL